MSSSPTLRVSSSNHTAQLAASLGDLLLRESLCDVTLMADARDAGDTEDTMRTVRAHQAVLSAASQWFEAVFAQSNHPGPFVVVKGVGYETLLNIVRFIYMGEVCVAQNCLQDFLEAAKMLDVRGINRVNGPEEDNVVNGRHGEGAGSRIDSVASVRAIRQQQVPLPPASSNYTGEVFEDGDEAAEEDEAHSRHVRKRRKRNISSRSPIVSNEEATQLPPSSSTSSSSSSALCPSSVGVFKPEWAERYLSHSLGREIICLVCLCRFTQFKKFNLDRHMRNKHPQLYSLPESSRKTILSRYLSRYEEHATPGMVAAVPAHGNQDLADEILAVGPICIQDVHEDEEEVEDGEEKPEVWEVKPIIRRCKKEYF